MAGFDPNWFALIAGSSFIISVFLVVVAYRSKMPIVIRVGFFILGLMLLVVSLAFFWMVLACWGIKIDVNV